LLTIEQLTDDYAAIEELTNAPALPMPPNYATWELPYRTGSSLGWKRVQSGSRPGFLIRIGVFLKLSRTTPPGDPVLQSP